MSIDLTLRHIPETGVLLRECGLPLSCIVQPFAPISQESTAHHITNDDLARCKKCCGYINPFCSWDQLGWACAICGTVNDFSLIKHARYLRPSAHLRCPELHTGQLEISVNTSDAAEQSGESGDPSLATPPEPEGTLAYIALVDTSVGGDALDTVKSGLLAALEAMPSNSLAGIITYADTIGLTDVRGRAPCIRHIPVQSSQGVLEFSEVLPLEGLLVPVGQYKEALSAAADALQVSATGVEASQAPVMDDEGGITLDDSQLAPKRAFGAALQGCLRYVAGLTAMQDLRKLGQLQLRGGAGGHSSSNGVQQTSLRCAGIRVMVFSSGVPNHGPGALLTQRYFHPRAQLDVVDTNPYIVYSPPPSDDDEGKSRLRVVLNDDAVRLYAELAAAAAALGVCIDLYCLGPGYMGLQYLRTLATRTGGVMCLYPLVEEAALPQDVYKRLITPTAFNGLLRLRTCSMLKVTATHGLCWPDAQYDNLHHLGGCTPHDALAYDLEYSRPSKPLFKDSSAQGTPLLQLVFQYSVLVPAENALDHQSDKSGSQAAEVPPNRYVMRRRMRILTVPLSIADASEQVYRGAHTDAILCCLMHRVLKVAAREGNSEGRLLLRDWLINLAARYNWMTRAAARLSQPMVDVTFEGVVSLQPLPRLLYALIRSPLLEHTPKQHPDLRAAVQHLWSSLPPKELAAAVYPTLSSWTSVDAEFMPRHSLSRAALLTANMPLYLLDSYSQLLLLYTRSQGDQPAPPFPPPARSLLQSIITQRKQQRRLTPTVRILRQGIDNTSPFDACLIEDAHGPADDEAGATSFLSFLGQVRSESESYITTFPGHSSKSTHTRSYSGGPMSPTAAYNGASPAIVPSPRSPMTTQNPFTAVQNNHKP